ncbi:hypothetical protein A4H97_11635 [Niastella yeongjuensis]|uniref:Outer membrane protein beta-barrel domain-containing protein n=1 Tax=Niastella yeongjuensis TaxID=354355 RepID=A0A1V9EA58_9BACT|nr:hypothetical protein [Niastella yeongjuensis]OQP42805.1 hypothetical protein A4H97_11635 [Niastella yeongjuensis]SEO54822.1 hypothetical protein SAMN05660816_02994 [Niastella yeongjuensis]
MDVINKCLAGLVILLVLTVPVDCFAQQKAAAPNNQRPQFYFDKPITLDSLTKYVHTHSSIRFSFNSSKVKGDKIINLKKGSYTIGMLLQEIRKNTSLYYSMFKGYVIFQDNPPKQQTATAKINPHKKNNLSHHKPVRKVMRPVPQTRPGDTILMAAHTNPDTSSRVVVVNTPAPHPDTANVARRTKDTTAGNLLLTTMAGKAPDNDYIDVVKNTNGQVEKGKPITPVYKGSAAQPWIKDTMQTKTKVVRADVSKKDGRTVVQPARKEKDEEDNRKIFHTWHWQYGLHWKGTVPLNGDGHYFTGPNNRSQPYNLLIPGIWLSRHNEHHEVLLLVKPAEWTSYNNNVIKVDSTVKQVAVDSVTSVNVWTRHTSSFIKSGGIYFGLQYNLHINENFVIGAGIGYQTLGQTLVQRQSKLAVDTARNKVAIPDTMYSVKNDSLTNRYLNSHLIMAKFEAAYKLGPLDLGAAIVVPFGSAFTSQSKEQKRSLNLQLFVRWRLKREEETD